MINFKKKILDFQRKTKKNSPLLKIETRGSNAFLKTRWIVLLIVLFCYFVIDYYNIIDPSLQNPLLFYFCLLLSVGFNYYLYVLSKSENGLKLIMPVIIIFDMLIVTFLIQSFGKSDSPFFLLYFLIIFGANIRYESKISAIVTIFCVLLFLIVSLNDLRLRGEVRIMNIIVKIISLSLYFFAFEWARQFKKRTQILNATIADTNNRLKEINEQLDFQKREVDKKNKLYREMLSFVSHELIVPLTPIISISSYHKMQVDLSIDEVKSSFEMINASANKLKNMIDKFLGLSKIERGEVIVDYRKMELINDIITPSIAELKMRADEKNMRILMHPASNVTSVIIYSDPSLLTVVFNNLFSNAIKYGYANTDITYLIRLKYDRLECSVINFGDGIPPDKLEAVFEKFVRLDDTRHKIEGTGLGLFNTREIIRKLNGDIKCESVLNHLTTFTFWLPLEKGDDIDEY